MRKVHTREYHRFKQQDDRFANSQMIFRAFDEFTVASPAVFWSQLSPVDAAKLLAEDARRGKSSANDSVVTRINGTNVLLHKGSFALNPFAPIFDGNLRAAECGSQLVGEFRRRKIVLLFCGLAYLILLPCIPFVLAATPIMSIWLGASLLWGAVAGALSALALLGILFGLAALMRVGMYAASRDASRMSEHLGHVFRRDSA